MNCLEGNKVNLRPIIKEDIEPLNRWKNKEDVYMFLGGGFQPISRDQQEMWMNSMIDQTGSNRRFMIIAEQKTVGMIGLYSIHWVHRTCEIGLFIGEKDARGKGYAKEAYQLLEQYANDYLNLRKISLRVVSDNSKAVSMWYTLGFKKAGELVQERFIKGKYHNVLIMEKILKIQGGGIANPD